MGSGTLDIIIHKYFQCPEYVEALPFIYAKVAQKLETLRYLVANCSTFWSIIVYSNKLMEAINQECCVK